jgi:hypothetical protein
MFKIAYIHVNLPTNEHSVASWIENQGGGKIYNN